jgi:GT2 family glycosyltransferase
MILSDPPLISVLIPTYQDLHLLARSLPTLLQHRADETEIFILNNDPAQDVIRWLKAELGITPGGRLHVVEMGYDGGYARAANRGIALSRGEIVFICNADLFPEEDFVKIMCDFFDSHERVGIATGKIMRYDIIADIPTRIIDTAGLTFTRNRRLIARGEGEIDVGRFDEEQEVFGIDGAVVVARRSALDSVELDGEYFDESFFMHKEDWDLSWRMRLMGWECWYVPDAVAYHCRTTRDLKKGGSASTKRMMRANERAKSQIVRFHALKNQWLMLIKNEDWANLWRDLPFVMGREAAVVGYNVVYAPRTLHALSAFAALVRPTLRKRRQIKKRQIVSAEEVRLWLDRV